MNEKNQLHNNEYASRLNKVIDYINANLDEALSLEKMAQLANYSQFHFHRLFKTIIGETVNKYVQRLRIEKAAVQLVLNKNKTITEIAFDCGFSSSQSLAKVFSQYFKMSASKWRETYLKNSKIEHTNSKIRKDINSFLEYIHGMKKADNMLKPDIKINNFNDMYVVYTRHIGPYKGDSKLFRSLYKKLFNWIESRDLFNKSTKFITLYNDFYGLTEESKLKITICATVPKDTSIDGNIGKLCIKGGKYAVFHFEIFENQYEAAWALVYGQWLPESGYQPADKPPFEILYNDPKSHPQNKHILDICLPIIPL